MFIRRGTGKEAMTIKRNHQTIVVADLSPESLDAICQHNLRMLEFKDIKEAVESSVFIKILNKLPNLKALYAYINIKDYNIPEDQKVQLNHLEKLNCYIDILQLLDVKSLTKLELDFDHDSFSCGDFINHQKNLQELKLMGYYSSHFFQDPAIFELKCRLSHFTFSSLPTFYCHEEFIKFLQLHQDSLQSLVLEGIGESHEIVKKFILGNLTNLKSLTMFFLTWDHFFSEIPMAKATKKNLKKQRQVLFPVNIGLKIENLRCIITNGVENNRFIFDTFSNLKYLQLDCRRMDEDSLKDNLLYIGRTLRNLETLKIREIGSSEVHFPQLKYLGVDEISKPDIFNKFIRRHSNSLEKVEIKDGEMLNQGTVAELMNCGKLKHLIVLSEDERFSMFDGFSHRRDPFILRLKYYRLIFPDDIYWYGLLCA